MKNRYLIDSDLVLEGLLNRPTLSAGAAVAASVWGQLELKNSSDKGYITSVGLNKITKIVSYLVETKQEADKLFEIITSVFEEIEVDQEIIQEALKLNSNLKDFESAIEVVCAKELKINTIVTDREECFLSLNPESISLDSYIPKIMGIENFILESKKNAKKSLHQEAKFSDGDRHISLINSNLKEKNLSNLDDVSTIFKVNELIPAFINLENVLSNHPDLMVEFGITFVDKYGGEDLDDYYERYDIIKNHWSLLKYILDFCYFRASSGHQDYYSKFMLIWNRLNRFCDLYGYWDNRIDYLNLAIELSSKYQMFNELFESLNRKSWTLVMQHKLGDAKKHLNRAEELRQQKNIENSSSLFYFYHCQFTFYTHSNDLIKAEEALLKLAYLAVAKEGENINISDDSLKRRKINIARSSAKLDRLQARDIQDENSKLSVELIERSLNKYLLCLEDAVSLGWKRGICYLYHKIADIYLDLADNDQENMEKRWNFLSYADTYLNQGQNIAIRNHNQRRIAGYLLSHARLSMLKADCMKESVQRGTDSFENLENLLGRQKCQKIYQEAIDDSTQAKDKYQELKNKTKVKECRKVIEKCQEQLAGC